MPIKRRPRHEKFVQIDHDTIRDRRLSWKARGLLAYLLSLPDDWEISFQELTKQSPRDKATSLRAAFKELLATGYATLQVVRNEAGNRAKGRRYVVADYPMTPEALADMQETPILDPSEVQETRSSENLKFSNTEAQETCPITKDLQETKIHKDTKELSRTKDPLVELAQEVLAYLNAKTGRRYRDHAFILARLRRTATVEECRLVIDWWQAVKVPQSPDQAQYFDNVTPFRPGNFDKYRAAAEAWQARGPTTTTTTSNPYDLTLWVQEETSDDQA